jgi:excisionase family DNA binding protein
MADDIDRLKDPDRLLTVSEAATRLGFTEATIRSWLEDGRLRGMKFPKGWRIDRADFEAFVNAARNVDVVSENDELGGLWDDELDEADRA